MAHWKTAGIVLAILVVAALGEGAPSPAHAATTRVWTGAVNLNWSTPGNWDPPGPPADGDALVFGAPAAGKTLVNDAGPFDVVNNRPLGVNLSSLTFNAGAAFATLTLIGNPVSISKSIHMEGIGILRFNLPVALRDDVEGSVSQGNGAIVVGTEPPTPAGVLATNGHTLTTNGPGGFSFWGDVTGAGTLLAESGIMGIAYGLSFTGTIAAASGAQVGFGNRGPVGSLCGSAPKALVKVDGLLTFGCEATIGGLAGSGEVSLYRQNVPLHITGRGSDAVFAGKLTNAQFGGSVICCSEGEQILSGASSMFGYVLVNAGSLFLQGGTFSAQAAFTVQGGAGFRPTLGGYGAFGPTIVTDANLSLDSLNGTFGFARFPTLQLAPSATVTFEVKGSTPGVGFTQVVVTGDTFLDNALLSIDFNGFEPAAGQPLTLIKGGQSLFDTFRNAADSEQLPEGASFVADKMTFTISYKGGAGKDVVITRSGSAASPTPSPTATPTGTPKPGGQFKRIVPMVSNDR